MKVSTWVRWGVLACTATFIGHEIVQHGQAVAELSLSPAGLGLLLGAGAVTLCAHLWAGWVWHWLLRLWRQPGGKQWAVHTYLRTNLHKYLPGNVWHFYGRLRAVQGQGGSLVGAAASVIAEPLLMAVAAVGVAAIASTVAVILPDATVIDANTSALSAWIHGDGRWLWLGALWSGWAITLFLLRPGLLNPRLASMSSIKLAKLKRLQPTRLPRQIRQRVSRFSNSETSVQSGPAGVAVADSPWTQMTAESTTVSASDSASDSASSEPPLLQLAHYPLKGLLGEMGFVGVRSLGFILTVMALAPLTITDLPQVVAAFSLAWVVGLIVPGAPGGIGVFETVAIALLSGLFDPAQVLGSVAGYRLVSTLAEVVGAVGVWPWRNSV